VRLITFLSWFNGLIGILLICFGYYLYTKKTTVAYVKTGVIIEKYQGMIDARNKLDRKAQEWGGNLDTLKFNLDKALISYNATKTKLSEKQKAAQELSLNEQKNVLMKYSEELELKAQKEEEQLTRTALNQINSYIEQYAKTKGYDLIVGTTTNGSLLYGAEKLDITEEILKELNKSYYSEK